MLSLVCGSKQLSNHEYDGECQPSGAKPVFGLYGSSGIERSAASDAVVAAVSSVSVSESDFSFEAPSRREHPVVSVSDTDSVEYAFIAVFVGVGEHECKGVQFCSPDVVDGEFGCSIEEVSIESQSQKRASGRMRTCLNLRFCPKLQRLNPAASSAVHRGAKAYSIAAFGVV